MMEKEKNRFQMYADAAAAKLAKKRQFRGLLLPDPGRNPDMTGKPDWEPVVDASDEIEQI